MILEDYGPIYKDAAWGLLREYPEANFDDYGPRTTDALDAELRRRMAAGELVKVVISSGRLVGMIGYVYITPRLGAFHGIAFTRSVHGIGVASRAVRCFLAARWLEGVEKIHASFFADNERAYRFLRKLGAVDEGLMMAQTLRAGVPVSMRLVAIFREDK